MVTGAKQVYRVALVCVALACAMFAVQRASAADVERRYEDTLAEVVRIAAERFFLHLKEIYRDAEEVPETIDLLEFAKNPESYSIGVSQTDTEYIVVFLRRRSAPFERVVGGGGEVHIRKAGLVVVDLVPYM